MRAIEGLRFSLFQGFGQGHFLMRPQESTKRDALNEIFNLMFIGPCIILIVE